MKKILLILMLLPATVMAQQGTFYLGKKPVGDTLLINLGSGNYLGWLEYEYYYVRPEKSYTQSINGYILYIDVYYLDIIDTAVIGGTPRPDKLQPPHIKEKLRSVEFIADYFYKWETDTLANGDTIYPYKRLWKKLYEIIEPDSLRWHFRENAKHKYNLID